MGKTNTLFLISGTGTEKERRQDTVKVTGATYGWGKKTKKKTFSLSKTTKNGKKEKKEK